MDNFGRRHLFLRPCLSGIASSVNIFTILWLFGGGQIFLFVSRTQGFWFDGFYGIFTGAIIVLAILAIFLSGPTLSLSRSDIILFLGFVLSLLTPILLSQKINSAEPDAIRKFLMIIPYAFVPGLWGLVFQKDLIKERTLFRLSILLLVIGNLFIFRYYSETTLAHFRAGTEASAIGLSYSFANLWILVLASSLLRKKIWLFSFASIVAPINVFLLSTRQSVVYITLVVFLLWFFWMLPLSICKKAAISITLSKKRTRTLTLALFLLIVFLASLQPVGLAMGRSNTLKNTFETAKSRWSSFTEGDYFDTARIRLFQKAEEVWKENLIFGQFAYENPGSNAHHLLMDLLSQYGLFGSLPYLLLLLVALSRLWKEPKDSFLTISYSLMFIAYLAVGLTVTSLLSNPVFHFLLFFWVSKKRGEGTCY